MGCKKIHLNIKKDIKYIFIEEIRFYEVHEKLIKQFFFRNLPGDEKQRLASIEKIIVKCRPVDSFINDNRSLYKVKEFRNYEIFRHHENFFNFFLIDCVRLLHEIKNFEFFCFID